MHTRESWKPVYGYPDYEASTLGRVRSLDRMINRPFGTPFFKKGRILKQTKTTQGYLVVTLSSELRAIGVHRVVMLAFAGPPPPKMEVCHNSPDKTDNRLTNLRYDTRKSNIRDRLFNPTGSINHKLKPDDVSLIRRTAADAIEDVVDAMAKRFEVDHNCIRGILARRSWRWL